MTTNNSWAAAIAIAASTLIAVGCQSAPETQPSASAGSADERRASDRDTSAATGAATSGQQSRSTEGAQAGTSPQSASTGSAETATSGSAPTAYEITGRVDNVDESSIEIAGKKLKIDSSTSVMKGGIGASLDDVKQGDEVRASLSGSADPPKAERIEVISGTSDSPAPDDRTGR